MGKSSDKEGSSDNEGYGPFELRSAENSARSPLALSKSPVGAAANVDEDDPAIGSLEPPVRQYSCGNYDTCLDLAAALNWASFTCGKCKGMINEQLMWRARHVTRKDAVAKALCELPPVAAVEPDFPPAPRKKPS